MFNHLIPTFKASGVTHIVAVPCSEFAAFLRDAVTSNAIPVLLPQREDEGIALMIGLAIGGQKPLGVFQDSLLGNSQNILSVVEAYASLPLKLWLGARTGRYLTHNPVHFFITDRLQCLLPPSRKSLKEITISNTLDQLSPLQERIVKEFLVDPTPGFQAMVFRVSE